MAKTRRTQKIVHFKRYFCKNGRINEKPTQSATIIPFPAPKPFDKLYAELLPRDQKFLDDLLDVFAGDKEATLGLWEAMELYQKSS